MKLMNDDAMPGTLGLRTAGIVLKEVFCFDLYCCLPVMIIIP